MLKIKAESSKGFPHSVTLEISGDLNGNSQKNKFTFEGDQFSWIGDELSFEFYGTWELHSFFDLIQLLKAKCNEQNI